MTHYTNTNNPVDFPKMKFKYVVYEMHFGVEE